MHATVIALMLAVGFDPLASNSAPVASQQRLAQMHAAASLWMVDVSLRAEGEFVRTKNGERVGADTVARLDFGGSAVAVTADGNLLTNRHVVDPRYMAAVVCRTLILEEYSAAALTSLRIDYSFFDAAREPVRFSVTVSPKTGDADLCTDPMQASFVGRTGDATRIVALDANADLALVKLAVADVPFLPLADRSLETGDPVYALGFNENDALVRADGPFESWCVAVEEDETPGDIIFLPQPEPMMRIKAPIRSGMSGGAVMRGADLIGITAKGESECEDGKGCTNTGEAGFALPIAYVHAWYLWITGKTAVRPEKVCELPQK